MLRVFAICPTLSPTYLHDGGAATWPGTARTKFSRGAVREKQTGRLRPTTLPADLNLQLSKVSRLFDHYSSFNRSYLLECSSLASAAPLASRRVAVPRLPAASSGLQDVLRTISVPLSIWTANDTMSSSRLSDDDFDSYIDPAAYDLSPCGDATSPSPKTAVAGPSSDSLHDLRIMNTTDRDALYAYPTNLSIFGERTDPAYCVEQVDLDLKLHTKRESPHSRGQAGQDGILERPSFFHSAGMDYDLWPLSRADLPGDPSYQLGQYPDSMTHWEDSSLCCNSSSTQSTPEADSWSIKNAPALVDPKSLFELSTHRPSRLRDYDPPLHLFEHVALFTPSSSFSPTRASCHSFSSSSSLSKDLKRHIKSIHEQETWPCPEEGCGHRFPRSDKLLLHQRMCHRSSAVEEESGTQSTFSSCLGDSLGSDLQSTMADRPVVLRDRDVTPKTQEGPQEVKKRLDCDFCEKSFSLRHDQLRHIRTLHRNQENFVYRCAVRGCSKQDKLFNRLDNFKKHLKKRHDSANVEEMVLKSRTFGGGTITIMTPDIGSRMQ